MIYTGWIGKGILMHVEFFKYQYYNVIRELSSDGNKLT